MSSLGNERMLDLVYSCHNSPDHLNLMDRIHQVLLMCIYVTQYLLIFFHLFHFDTNIPLATLQTLGRGN